MADCSTYFLAQMHEHRPKRRQFAVRLDAVVAGADSKSLRQLLKQNSLDEIVTHEADAWNDPDQDHRST